MTTDSLRMPDVAAALYARIQRRMSECGLRTQGRGRLRGGGGATIEAREPIDPVEDQVRLYPLADRTAQWLCSARGSSRNARFSGS
jgi:hypothetical protein